MDWLYENREWIAYGSVIALLLGFCWYAQLHPSEPVSVPDDDNPFTQQVGECPTWPPANHVRPAGPSRSAALRLAARRAEVRGVRPGDAGLGDQSAARPAHAVERDRTIGQDQISAKDRLTWIQP